MSDEAQRKPWYLSKTLWFNALVGALVAAEASFQLLQPVLSVNVYGAASFLLTVGNAFLRVITTQGVGR